VRLFAAVKSGPSLMPLWTHGWKRGQQKKSSQRSGKRIRTLNPPFERWKNEFTTRKIKRGETGATFRRAHFLRQRWGSAYHADDDWPESSLCQDELVLEQRAIRLSRGDGDQDHRIERVRKTPEWGGPVCAVVRLRCWAVFGDSWLSQLNLSSHNYC
jgi:hypothetical protein